MLIIIIAAIVILYIILLTYIITQIVVIKNNQNLLYQSPIQNNVSETCDINTSSSCNFSQTEFYKKSVDHAEKVLFGKVFDPQYGESNFYGNRLIDTINKINNETKQSVIIAIKYFSIEPSQARNNEQLFRTMSQQEGVPLWFIILREAVKKAVPEFAQESNTTTMQTENKIVPLYQRTG